MELPHQLARFGHTGANEALEDLGVVLQLFEVGVIR
jgi:hypothetical protein